MAISERVLLAGTTAAALCLGLPQPILAQAPRLPLRIVVYDYAKVPPDVLARAQDVVSRTFDEIGIDAEWMDVAAFTR
jgi:hypothetical protein